MEILVFNNHINGDWKRQNYYRPSREDHARMALYEWKHDPQFRGPMGQSIGMVDLEGAFEKCPIPTMIMEGSWDLTWNTDKPGILQKNHPGSKLVMFEESSHNPFQDEPKKFFAELKDFIRNLPEVTDSEIEEWNAYLVSWEQEMEMKPGYLLRTAGYGKKDNDRISELYSDQWLEEVYNPGFLLKLGFALYDGKKYEDALKVFQKMQEKSGNNNYYVGIAMIWQGHMLDLLGRRSDAVAIYQKVADKNLNYRAQHDQFGLKIEISPWAAERIKVPFKRIENSQE
jgi:tetratricopeptide (TPR) repeat protein